MGWARWAIAALAIAVPFKLSAQQPVFKLPYAKTEWASHACVQGNQADPSHDEFFTQYALDFDTPNLGQLGDPENVVAAASGVAYVFDGCSRSSPSNCNHGYGNHVKVHHTSYGNLFSLYAHLDYIFVQSGDVVFQGQVIGEEGLTGATGGDHIHFDVQNGDPSVDILSTSVPLEQIEVLDRSVGGGVQILRGDQFACGLPGGHVYGSTNLLSSSVEVVTGALNVRGPGACDGAIGTESIGATGSVIGGPQYCDGFNRWQVVWADGTVGWSAEHRLQSTGCFGILGTPSTNSTVVFPETFTWARYGNCTSPAIAFATAPDPDEAFVLDGPISSRSVDAELWESIKQGLGAATIYYWTFVEVFDGSFSARTSWRPFSEPQQCVLPGQSLAAATPAGTGAPCVECGNGVVEVGEGCDEGTQNGTPGSCCESDCTLKPAGRICRVDAGLCDVAETCDGVGPVCPADVVFPSNILCRGASNQCDAQEFCTGGDPECPPDLNAPNGTSCNDGNACTTADTCQGGTCSSQPVTCSDDGNVCTTHFCNPATGLCDATTNPGAVCRPSTASCDPEEACPVTNINCPPDVNTCEETCGNGALDPGEECDDGSTSSGCCSASCTLQVGASCDDGSFCTISDTCDSTGVCVGQARTCDDDSFCTGLEACDELSDQCVSSGNPCPSDEVCSEALAACLADADQDGVPDNADNCTWVSNLNQTDSDMDGCGNPCDCDFDNSGFCNVDDFSLFLPDFAVGAEGTPGTDMSSDGFVNVDDFSLFLPGFSAGRPGPSGLSSSCVLPGGGCTVGPLGAEVPLDGELTAADCDSELSPFGKIDRYTFSWPASGLISVDLEATGFTPEIQIFEDGMYRGGSTVECSPGHSCLYEYSNFVPPGSTWEVGIVSRGGLGSYSVRLSEGRVCGVEASVSSLDGGMVTGSACSVTPFNLNVTTRYPDQVVDACPSILLDPTTTPRPPIHVECVGGGICNSGSDATFNVDPGMARDLELWCCADGIAPGSYGGEVSFSDFGNDRSTPTVPVSCTVD